jgi:hypothetical protein
LRIGSARECFLVRINGQFAASQACTHLAEADLGRALVELCLLIDASSEIDGVELIAPRRAIGIEPWENLALQKFTLSGKFGEGR